MAKSSKPTRRATARRPRQRATSDPVSAFARRSVDATGTVGRFARLACARHLRDVETGSTRGLVWRAEKATEAIHFYRDHLTLPDVDASTKDGEEAGGNVPFVLLPFWQFIVGSLCGWYRVDGTRRFSHAYIEAAKGSAKTPVLAGLGLYVILVDGGTGSQVISAGVTRTQATDGVHADAVAMVRRGAHLKKYIRETTLNLSVPTQGSFMRPMSSDARSADGKRIQLAIVDELHEHPRSAQTDKLREGLKGRKNGLVVEITNAGYDQQSVCWQHHETSRHVLEGTADNDEWFAYMCGLDPCDACRAEGYQQPNLECPTGACDRWDVEGEHWLKANPALGVIVPWRRVAAHVTQALQNPANAAMTQRLQFCMWTGARVAWVAPERWAACAAVFDVVEHRRAPCYVGVDLSSKLDLTSVVLLFPRASEQAPIDLSLPVAMSDSGEPIDDDRPTIDLNIEVDILPFAWLPKETLTERVARDRIRYDLWADQGFLRVTPGAVVDYDAILDWLVREIKPRYAIQAIGYDPHNATHAATRLKRVFGDESVIEVSQSFGSLNEPMQILEALIRARRVRHPDNPVMNWALANTGIERNRWLEVRPVKLSDIQRIDPVVAALNGFAVLLRKPVKKRSRWATGGGYIIGRDGIARHAMTGEPVVP